MAITWDEDAATRDRVTLVRASDGVAADVEPKLVESDQPNSVSLWEGLFDTDYRVRVAAAGARRRHSRVADGRDDEGPPGRRLHVHRAVRRHP